MTFTSKLEQLEQIHGSLNYNDDISDYPLAQAETHGKIKGSGSDGSVLTASPTQFSSLSFTFTAQHVGDFIRIPSGANAGTYKITGFIDANTVSCASASFTTESSLSFEIRQWQNLEDDLNYTRTQLREILGAGVSDWFSDIPTYTNPKDTGTPKRADLSTIAGKTTDAVLRLYPKEAAGQSVSAGNTEISIADTTRYTDTVNKTGLPVSDTGELDETNFSANWVEIIDPQTGGPVKDASDTVIFGRLIKGTELTNVKVKFFKDDPLSGSASAFTWTAAEPTVIDVVYAERFTVFDLPEDIGRKRFRVGLEADAELVNDLTRIKGFVGSDEDDLRPTWANTAGFFPLDADPDNLESGINDINDAIGDRQYSANANLVIDDGETITASLEKLAGSLADTNVEKITEIITSTIAKETAHTLPGSKTYVPDTGGNGQHMDIILNQGFLTADKLTQTADYDETSATTVTFHGNINASAARPAVLTYLIRKSS